MDSPEHAADRIEASFGDMAAKRRLLRDYLNEGGPKIGETLDSALLHRNALLVSELRDRQVPIFSEAAA